MNSRLLRKWGVPSISLCLFFLIPQLIGAQTCPNLAGATSFAPKSGHESDYFYTLDNVELEGPLGNFFGTDAKMAEFGYVHLSELENLRLPFGMKIERDLYMEKDCDLIKAMKRTGITPPNYLLEQKENDENLEQNQDDIDYDY